MLHLGLGPEGVGHCPRRLPTVGWTICLGSVAAGSLELIGFPAPTTRDLTSPVYPLHLTPPQEHPVLVQRCEVTFLGWASRGASWGIGAQILLLPSIQFLDRAKESTPTSCPLSPG